MWLGEMAPKDAYTIPHTSIRVWQGETEMGWKKEFFVIYWFSGAGTSSLPSLYFYPCRRIESTLNSHLARSSNTPSQHGEWHRKKTSHTQLEGDFHSRRTYIVKPFIPEEDHKNTKFDRELTIYGIYSLSMDLSNEKLIDFFWFCN